MPGIVDRLLELDPDERHEALAGLTNEEAAVALYDFELWALPHQQIPSDDEPWNITLVMGGRGSGKTRAGAERMIRRAREVGQLWRGALVGATASDVRDVMVEGESGILACSPPWFRPEYEPSKRRVVWPNGARAFCYSAEEPMRLRGPQHHDAWADELSYWRYLDDCWSNLILGLRLGPHARTVVTMTPRFRPLIRTLIERASDPDDVRVLHGSMLDNPYLPQAFRDEMVRIYGGTRLGATEIEGRLLEDVEGALWRPDLIQRREPIGGISHLTRTVVAIDPSDSAKGDDAGIVGAGIQGDYGFVVADASGQYTPDGWAAAALAMYEQIEADALVVESNLAGNMAASVIRSAALKRGMAVPRIIAVRAGKTGPAATRGAKAARAEPVVALYEQGLVFHAEPFPYLEDQMQSWVPQADKKSPGAIDALVWALTNLMVDRATPGRVSFAQGNVPSIGPRR